MRVDCNNIIQKIIEKNCRKNVCEIDLSKKPEGPLFRAYFQETNPNRTHCSVVSMPDVDTNAKIPTIEFDIPDLPEEKTYHFRHSPIGQHELRKTNVILSP